MVSLESNNAYKNRYSQPVQITSASILTTEWCNLDCKYCYEKSSHRHIFMDIDTAKAVCDFLFNNAAKPNSTGEVHFMFFGGEPTLNPEVLEFFYEYGCDKHYSTGIPLSASIVTNATNMNDRVYNIFQKYIDNKDIPFTTQLSVDGKKEIHNIYRVTKNGNGSFDLLEKNIPIFKELYKKEPNMLSIHGCLNKQSIPHLYENYLFFREEWGFQQIWFLPVMEENWEDSDVEIYDQQLGKIYNYILDVVKATGDIKEVMNYSPIDKLYGCFHKKEKPCGAGTNYATITSIGEIYPCHQIYFQDENRESLCGNIYTGVDDDKRRVFLEYDGTDLTCDPNCAHSSCYRCIAVNWVLYGSIFSQIQKHYCQFMKIDQKYQTMMRKELDLMGIRNDIMNKSDDDFKPHPDDPNDCRCKYRGCETERKIAMENDGLEYVPSVRTDMMGDDQPEMNEQQENIKPMDINQEPQIISIKDGSVKYTLPDGSIHNKSKQEYDQLYGIKNDQNPSYGTCSCAECGNCSSGSCPNTPQPIQQHSSSPLSEEVIQTFSTAFKIIIDKLTKIEKQLGI